MNFDINHKLSLDGVKYPLFEVKAYKNRGTYYIRLDSGFIKRIIHGKINVYVLFDEETGYVGYHGVTVKTHYSFSKHYAQRGENGPLILLANREVLVDLVKDCPLSVSMIGDEGYEQLKKGNKDDPDYLNNICNIYNNGCKAD